MSFWLRNMRDEISVESYTGNNTYGEATYAAAVAYPARVENYSNKITLDDGTEVTVSHRAATTALLKVGDLVTLPSGIGRTVRGVQSAERLRASQTLTVVVLG